jgi:hypothetical protein
MDVCYINDPTTGQRIASTCGNWISEPSKSGTHVTWSTKGDLEMKKDQLHTKLQTKQLSYLLIILWSDLMNAA